MSRLALRGNQIDCFGAAVLVYKYLLFYLLMTSRQESQLYSGNLDVPRVKPYNTALK
jgi:hypothetical protein